MILETILITLFLLLPPVVLGKCRSFCERHPSTVAFRTVPIGCLTMFLLTVLLGVAVSWFYHSILKIKPLESGSLGVDSLEVLLILLLAVPAGIAVIVFLSERYTRQKERPHGCLYPLVFIGALMVALTISCISTWSYLLFDVNQDSNWSPIPLPQFPDCVVLFEQRPSHPFLAEYDYRIRLESGDGSVIFRLWPNTGGRTFVNVYQLAEDKLLLKDKDTSYLVDTTQKQVYLIDLQDDSSKYLGTSISFAVPLSSKRISSLGRSIPFLQSESLKKTDSPEQYLSVTFADNTTAHAVPYEADLQNRKYIGCIMDYSFYTPDEQPEGAEHPRYRQRKKQ